MKVRKFPQTIKKFYHLPKYENSVVIQPTKANNGSVINVVVAKEPIKNIQQIIDAYIDKIIVYQNEIKVQLNFSLILA